MLESYIDIWLTAGENYRAETEAAVASLRCAYCGERAQTFDHVVPRAAGGLDVYENLVPACRSCNGAKAAKSLDEWAASIRMDLARMAHRQRQLDGINRVLASRDAAMAVPAGLTDAEDAELDRLFGDAA